MKTAEEQAAAIKALAKEPMTETEFGLTKALLRERVQVCENEYRTARTALLKVEEMEKQAIEAKAGKQEAAPAKAEGSG